MGWWEGDYAGNLERGKGRRGGCPAPLWGLCHKRTRRRGKYDRVRRRRDDRTGWIVHSREGETWLRGADKWASGLVLMPAQRPTQRRASFDERPDMSPFATGVPLTVRRPFPRASPQQKKQTPGDPNRPTAPTRSAVETRLAAREQAPRTHKVAPYQQSRPLPNVTAVAGLIGSSTQVNSPAAMFLRAELSPADNSRRPRRKMTTGSLLLADAEAGLGGHWHAGHPVGSRARPDARAMCRNVSLSAQAPFPRPRRSWLVATGSCQVQGGRGDPLACRREECKASLCSDPVGRSRAIGRNLLTAVLPDRIEGSPVTEYGAVPTSPLDGRPAEDESIRLGQSSRGLLRIDRAIRPKSFFERSRKQTHLLTVRPSPIAGISIPPLCENLRLTACKTPLKQVTKKKKAV